MLKCNQNSIARLNPRSLCASKEYTPRMAGSETYFCFKVLLEIRSLFIGIHSSARLSDAKTEKENACGRMRGGADDKKKNDRLLLF